MKIILIYYSLVYLAISYSFLKVFYMFHNFFFFFFYKQIIICGGLSAFMKGMSIWSLDLEKLEWNKIPQDAPTNNRFGHTSIIYQNKIFLFGGRTKYGGSFVSPGLEIFSLK